MTTSKPAQHREGLSLLELLVAVVVLGIAAAGLGKLMLGAAQEGQIAGAMGYRTTVLNGEIARVTAALPGSLPDGTTTTMATAPPFPYILTTTVVTAGTTQTVTITVRPMGERAIPAVVRTVQRALTNSPLGGP